MTNNLRSDTGWWIFDTMMHLGITDVFHVYMFHGTQHRLGATSRYTTSHHAGEDLTEPVRLRRNGYRFPDCIMPSASLIVSSKLRDILSELPGVSFLRTIVEKVVYLPFEEGKLAPDSDTMMFQSILGDPDPATLIDRLPVADIQSPPYFELIIPRLADLGETGEQWSFVYKDPDDCNVESLNVPADGLGGLSAFSCIFGLAVSTAFLNAISDYVDWRYFYRSPLNRSDETEL